MPDTCRSIDLWPLKITGDVDESVVRSKLKLITKITSGVEVTETGISTFDFLPNVEILTNKDGPALKFHRNKKLARIILPKLKQFKGKEEAVLFDHDQFPTLAKKEKKGLRDLTMLRDIAMKSTGSEGKATCNNFAKVIKNEPAEPKGVWIWVWILPALVCAVNALFIAYSCWKEHSAKIKKVLPMFFMPVIAAHSSGILLYVTENQTFLLWIAFASLGGMCAAIMSLFEHRHQVIVTNSWFVMKRRSTRIIFFTILYFTMVNFGIPEILTVPEDQETEKLKAFHRYPCIPVIIFEKMSRVLQSDASLFNPHMYLTCASLGGLCCFYCSHIMWNLLPRNNPSMSRSTRKMLISFFISMCIQVAIPVIVIYIPNIYWNVSISFDFHSQELNNISIVLFTLHGTSSSIATIFIYSPYRKFTKELLLYGILRLPVSRVSPLVVSVTDRSIGRTAAPTF